MKLYWSSLWLYAAYGCAFGCLFPVAATLLDINTQQLALSWSAVLMVQRTQPLHWLIDSAPPVLTIAGAFAGWRQQQAIDTAVQLRAQSKRLNDTLRSAEAQAQTLSRLNDENRALYEQTDRDLRALQTLQQERSTFIDTIRALSLPVIAVEARTLVMPLIGAFDVERLQQLATTALDGVERHHCTTMIFDCTGVAAIAPDAVPAFTQIVAMLRLLGAQAVLSGVPPTLAAALVAGGLDRPIAQTAASLATALATIRAA